MAKHKSKPIKFSWDPEKAEKNESKYGVSFDEAMTIFKDPVAMYFDDLEHSQKQKREMVIGRSMPRERLLTCVFERTESGIHIINARISTHRERQDYDDNSEVEYQIQ